MFCTYPKAVHINAYKRLRCGRFEQVCEHCRSFPDQLKLF